MQIFRKYTIKGSLEAAKAAVILERRNGLDTTEGLPVSPLGQSRKTPGQRSQKEECGLLFVPVTRVGHKAVCSNGSHQCHQNKVYNVNAEQPQRLRFCSLLRDSRQVKENLLGCI